MAIVVALLLAVFVVPAPWGYALVGAGVVYEVGTAWLGWHWSRRQRKVVGAAALVGAAAEVVAPCRPDGWVKVRGERWRARCTAGAEVGAEVTIAAVDGLVLVVEPVRAER